MLLICDTREQKPWTLAELDLGETVTGIINETMNSGDYSISGYKEVLTVERKSLGDLVQTLIRDWIRFRKQLNRMAGMDLAVIVAETTLADICDRKYEGDAHPNLILGRCNDCLVDHGIPVMLWGERGKAATMSGRLMRKFVERQK